MQFQIQIVQDRNFLVSRNDVFVLVVVFDSIVLPVEILAPKDSTTNEDVNLFLLMVYQHSEVFLAFNINIRDLVYE